MMQQFQITSIEENQNIMTYLRTLMPILSTSFLRKMMRTKIIKLNDQKITGKETLKSNDMIKIYVSQDMFVEFSRPLELIEANYYDDSMGHPYHHNLNIIYEDDCVLLINKPIGLPSRSKKLKHSLIQDIAYYLSSETKDMIGYQLGITNYLDKNCSGIIISGKDIKSLQGLNYAMSHSNIEINYRTICTGLIEEETSIENGLIKPIKTNGAYTEIMVTMHNGIVHNVRAVLAEIGHPIIGDKKFGESSTNLFFKKHYGLNHYLIHVSSVTFKDMPGDLEYMSNHTYCVDLPLIYKTCQRDLFR
ncbi:MAG: pseudouridine synthase [Vallitaleaceae bacterium]|jgi:23S rRNA pseudouridine955/2504/2580 synthase|nr:pseudouridine synthase [Vallitaleaceae bacterium]